MAERVYIVLARKNREDPLHHIGSVHASDPELARVYAWKTYDEERWFEMVVAPRDAFHPVNRAEAPFDIRPETPEPTA
ncbi:MAG: phenylacetic acid degradation b [Gemmatimonadetes bacterium]|uniref:Phenylacetic acid degradation b n=1 Tax=Candidatus Kutchimonas denitrificans TaxID=3056748 RepID=A0AAE4Z9Z8_9BACT|nr:phenylacetic acid degradation b [Gemmatimonadota bacterium]NIR76520.1 phenylacetic acid degradation b [Candidatus Kutchimonas denitrificans]NIS03338.1 phenylacetic acid degradation b [Gemmatimonadota bacterium]NIT69199.1 phenylacetic acid degradation b [Gemmatimonadota bacterium]NIU54591.1 phenylacetic acid degradation b [Gemmatimonadota bacterium]